MSITLRDLPLPVKVVATVFLLAVGAGYGSAMVQLHMQDSKSGQPMPTVADVIRKYTGKIKYDPDKPPPVPMSRLESLVASDACEISGKSMAAAFTTEDRAKGDLKFATAIKGKSPEQVKRIEAERKDEQVAFALWINTPDAVRKATYDADKFPIPTGKAPALTPALKDGDALKIKTLIDARCANCHSKGGDKEDVPLAGYDDVAKWMKVEVVEPVNGYVKVEEPVSITKLTQSTHAHLLSFAVLFSLTGLIFACSSYPTGMRVILGPWVVIAVFADVSLWWLARLCDEMGPFFAMGIIATGGAAGLGVGAQITLSVFNMYGKKGKFVLALMFGAAAGFAGFMFVNKVKPILDAKQKDVQNPPAANGKDDKKEVAKKPEDKKVVPVQPKPHVPTTELERLLTLPALDKELKPFVEKVPFSGEGNMAAALFGQDKAYKKFMEGNPSQPEKDKLKAQREAELAALQLWVRSPDAARKAAYNADALDATELAGKLDAKFVKDGKVLVKSILNARCATCHGPDGKQEDYPLTKYEEFEKYLKPLAAAANANPGGVAPIPRAADEK